METVVLFYANVGQTNGIHHLISGPQSPQAANGPLGRGK